MSTLAQLPTRFQTENENHHLWNNHGTWFLHCTFYPTPLTKERIRRSLGTRDLALARRRRDTFFAQFGVEPGRLSCGQPKRFAA